MTPLIELRQALRTLDRRENIRDASGKAKALEEVTGGALAFPSYQRIALAGYLLESTDADADLESDEVWDGEIRDRIRAIDDGGVVGIPCEDVMRAAEQRLAS